MELTRQTLSDLSALRSDGNLVLSVYLQVDPVAGNLVPFPVAFREAVRELQQTLTAAEEQAALEREAKRVLRFLEHDFPRQGKGLVIFASAPASVWEVRQLAVPVPNLVHFDREPYIRPLAQIMEDWEPAAVLLVDKENARLYLLRLAEIEEMSEVFDEVPGKHKQGGWSAAAYQRHHEFHVREHLKHVLDSLAGLAKGQAFDRLILGGPPEALTEFRQLLPQELEQRVIGVLTLPVEAPTEEVRRAALDLSRDFEREDEERRVRELLEGAALGGRAAIGWAETLQALQDRKVWRLLVAAGFEGASFLCPRCGYLAAGDGACPACSIHLTAARDGVNRAMLLTLQQDGAIEVVSEHAAAVLLEHGGAGAILRF